MQAETNQKLNCPTISGYHETYSDTTRIVLDVLIRKGIGLFVFALLTSFLISAALHYMQVSFLERFIFIIDQMLKIRF